MCNEISNRENVFVCIREMEQMESKYTADNKVLTERMSS
jgi:hypothetical protein